MVRPARQRQLAAARATGGDSVMAPLAYIDPGAGSLFVQAVIATVLVVPFFLRSRIRAGLGKIRQHLPAGRRRA